MLIKYFLFAAIISGCTYLGVLLGERYKKRIIQLVSFQNALDILKFNILFLNQPLSEAMKKVSQSHDGVVEKIFSEMSGELTHSTTAAEVWRMIMEKYKRDLFLTDEEINVLLDFSERLGISGRDDQIDNIDAAITRLQAFEVDARKEGEKNIKMYRGLGVLSGILIVILFI